MSSTALQNIHIHWELPVRRSLCLPARSQRRLEAHLHQIKSNWKAFQTCSSFAIIEIILSFECIHFFYVLQCIVNLIIKNIVKIFFSKYFVHLIDSENRRKIFAWMHFSGRQWPRIRWLGKWTVGIVSQNYFCLLFIFLISFFFFYLMFVSSANCTALYCADSSQLHCFLQQQWYWSLLNVGTLSWL